MPPNDARAAPPRLSGVPTFATPIILLPTRLPQTFESTATRAVSAIVWEEREHGGV
jgi:hypothetical protein